MEQKRTVWILTAAGIFLCLVIGAAVLVHRHSTPKNTSALSLRDDGTVWVSPSSTQGTSAGTQGPAIATLTAEESKQGAESTLSAGISIPEEGVTSVDVASNAKDGTNPSQTITQADSVTVYTSGTTNVYQLPDGTNAQPGNLDMDMIKNGYLPGSNVTAANKAAEQAMRETAAARGQEYVASVPPASTKPASTKPAETKPEQKPSSSSASGTPAASTGKKPARSTNSSPAQKPAPSAGTEREPDRYWVQAASYASKKKADEARSILDQNKMQCEVFTYNDDTSGTLYYRVRVGPYSTRDEATYWKKQIDAIAIFTGTYIVNSSAPIAKK